MKENNNTTSLRASIIVAYHSVHEHSLKDAMESLAEQTIPRSEYEVILVNAEDDKPIDSEIKAIGNVEKNFNFHYFRISKRGRAAARNYGVQQAKAKVLLFYSIDFIATPRLLEEHLKLHEGNSEKAVVGIGPALFSQKLIFTSFMRWLEESGAVFGASFLPNHKIPDDFFYGANTSIKKSFLTSVGQFDERLPYQSVDDYDMGCRLYKHGMKTIYLPEALAYHDHQVTIEERRTAMMEAGKSTAILDSGSPNLRKRIRSIARLLVLDLLSTLYRGKYLLTRNEHDQWKYFTYSMTAAWNAGYISVKSRLRS